MELTALQTCCVNIANAGGYFFSFMARINSGISPRILQRLLRRRTDVRRSPETLPSASRMSEHLFFPPFIVLSTRKKKQNLLKFATFFVSRPQNVVHYITCSKRAAIPFFFFFNLTTS